MSIDRETNNLIDGIIKDKVSIWVGEFCSQPDLDDYLDLAYDERADFPSSVFTQNFEIDFYDDDFREAYCTEAVGADLGVLAEPLSYSETYVKNLPENSKKGNAIIALYNFEYDGKVWEAENVQFIGVFEYETDGM